MIFDGPNRLVIFETSDTDSVRAIDIYSEWKRWVSSSDGSKYPETFTTIGGQNLGGGLSAGAYFFLNTLDGWTIRPREETHELTIVGNLYPSVAGDDQFAVTLGAFQVAINLQTSSLTQQTETGGSTLTVQQIAEAVWAQVPYTDTTEPAGQILTRIQRKMKQAIALIASK